MCIAGRESFDICFHRSVKVTIIIPTLTIPFLWHCTRRYGNVWRLLRRKRIYGDCSSAGTWNLRFSTHIIIIIIDTFRTVRRIEPPIHPLAPAKMRCGMSLPTHKALRNRFLERFYVGDFFYPTSKIENSRKKSHFFLVFFKIFEKKNHFFLKFFQKN